MLGSRQTTEESVGLHPPLAKFVGSFNATGHPILVVPRFHHDSRDATLSLFEIHATDEVFCQSNFYRSTN
jgi:hypothetical protein